MSNITSTLLSNTSIMPSHLVLPTSAQLSTLSRIPLSIFVDALPRLLLTPTILFAYLLVPHVKRPKLYAARWMVLAIIVWLEYENVYGLKSIIGGKGHGGGLASGIVMLWAGTWLIWERPQWDAKRVWRRTKVGNVESEVAKSCCAESITDENTASLTIRHRSTKDPGQLVTSPTHTHAMEYYWQSYPTDSFRDRVFWTADLLLNFRGPGWNWAIRSLPSMPPHVLHDLGLPITPSSKNGISKTGLQRATSKSQIYSDIVPHALINWAVFHFCCIMLVTDPYFMLGAASTAPLPLHLAYIPSIVLVCLRRVLLGLVILASLELNNSFLLLNPILGPKYLGLHGEVWYYHTAFGSFHNITNYGLAGFWGGFWHQSFREAFTAPSDYLVRKGWLDEKAKTTKFVALSIAFALSAAFHVAVFASMKMQSVWPFFLFFVMQLPGVLLQKILEYGAGRLLPKSRVPDWIRKACSAMFAAAWLLVTCGGAVEQGAEAMSELYGVYKSVAVA